MKRFFTLAFYCLWLIAVYGQNTSEIKQNELPVNGIYLFDKAELFIRNSTTGENIEHKIIKDTASIDPYDLHLENIFLEVELQDNFPANIVMSDRQKYSLSNDIMALQPLKDYKKESQFATRDVENEPKYIYEGKQLLPYELKSEGNKLTITFSKYSFGQSDYNFTLEAELIVTLIKQKDDEANNI